LSESGRKPTTLMAGGHGSADFGTTPYLAEALRATGKAKPVALYIGAASGDHRPFGTALVGVIAAAGAGRVLWPKLVGRPRDRSGMRSALGAVDLVFLGGGDVEQGMDVLRDADLLADVRAAAERGAVFAGMSAGSIMLGERWIRWPHPAAGDDEAETYECLGIARCSVDTHGESDGWTEAQSFATVRARELGREARVYAIPTSAALVVGPSGEATARGAPVPMFSATPSEPASIHTTLAVTP
jgi:cyanophycinase-like exopeptidase